MARKKSILDLYKMKEAGEKTCWIVLYDSVFASYAEEAGIDMILCGDSMGMIVYGWPGTVPVTMDMSIAHCWRAAWPLRIRYAPSSTRAWSSLGTSG